MMYLFPAAWTPPFNRELAKPQISLSDILKKEKVANDPNYYTFTGKIWAGSPVKMRGKGRRDDFVLFG